VLPERAKPAAIVWLLILPDGSEIEPRIPVVIGRRPWVGSSDERSVVHIVAPSPRREISGVHLELSVVDGALHGRDLDSTNGTLVYSGGRPTRLLHGGRTTRLQLGDILDVGDAFSISIRTRN
jgi:pSer/pThr/pTyr-binding forkhead associated (FHA) protein